MNIQLMAASDNVSKEETSAMPLVTPCLQTDNCRPQQGERMNEPMTSQDHKGQASCTHLQLLRVMRPSLAHTRRRGGRALGRKGAMSDNLTL